MASEYYNLFRNLLYVSFILLGTYFSIVRSEYYFENEDRASQFGAPLILTEEEDLTLFAGLNHTITCESHVPITWSTPAHESEILSHDIVDYKTTNPQRPYGSNLTLFFISANNVNYYFCINKDSEKEKDLENLLTLYKASQIYVFVNDPNNLIVPVEHPVVTAFQYSDVIIPCKPTLKDIEVELIKMDDQVIDAHFDAKVGFVLNETDFQGSFTCIVPQTDQKSIFYLVFHTSTTSINKPEIVSPTNGHVHEGSELELKCTLDVARDVVFSMNWILPVNSRAIEEGRTTISPTVKINHSTRDNLQVGEKKLIIKNINKATDSGYYRCIVEDHSNNTNSQNIQITVLRPNENYINLTEPTNNYKMNVSTRLTTTKMVVQYRAHPPPILDWYDNRGQRISNNMDSNSKYNITRTSKDITLKIRNVDLSNYGEYRLKANNTFQEKEVVFQLIVRAKPMLTTSDVYGKIGEEVQLQCRCDSYPTPAMIWKFTPCTMEPKWPTCNEAEELTLGARDTSVISINTTSQKLDVRFKPTQPGIAKCIATNSEGSASEQARVFIGDIEEPFLVISLNRSEQIITGDRVVLMCGAVKFNYSPKLNWYNEQGELLKNTLDMIIKPEETEYSSKSFIIFKSIKHEDEGKYECRVQTLHDNNFENKIIDLKIFDLQKPKISFSNLGVDLERELAESIEFRCDIEGVPTPKVNWYKDDEKIDPVANKSHYKISNDGVSLNITIIKPEDEGTYKCEVSNRFGSAEKEGQLKISNLPGIKFGWIIVICVVIVVLLMLVIFLFIRIYRERKLLKEMKAAGLANFAEGAVEFINPTLTLDEQAEFLPYDKRFEFPREKLKLGQQLGAGAFGVVLKATAEGIISDEKETVVAVKMVKKTADNDVMRALVSELKIMVHLGQHLNVVNLLGAITKNIAKREVMVIVEFCRYGNVHNFLLKNRKRFVNQIDPRTDQIDSSILTVEQQHSHNYEYNSQGLKYVKLSFSNQQSADSNGESTSRNSAAPNSQMNSRGYLKRPDSDYFCENIDSCNTENTYVTSNPEDQPTWRSNYKTDCADELDVNTTILMTWAFQVARGMDYLASRRVLHGDLAARNILLCDENVVKICDFGLAKSMYKSNNYKKQGGSPLPIKWLALESLGDQIFSTYSDIWSFGIVMWEFFSLAKTPYPGMEADQTLYLKLKDGYRMEKPPCANQDLYDIMLQCWSANPESRPSFNELEKRLGKMLEDDVANHYLDLNEPYLKMNEEYYKRNPTDYLSLMGCPDDVAPEPPRYIHPNKAKANNESLNDNTGNYLSMKPVKTDDIFSPRPQQDDYVTPSVFYFPSPNSPTTISNLDSPRTKNLSKETLPEQIPMLGHTNVDSDSELSPSAVDSDSKKFTDVDIKPDYRAKLEQDKVRYVNLPKSKDAISNPAYSILTKVDETKT